MDLFSSQSEFGGPIAQPKPVVTPQVQTWTPRPYQSEARDKAFQLWGQGMRGVMCRMATGMGKTATAAFTAQQWLAQGDDCRVMVLCHERQLAHQWKKELRKFTGLEIGVEMAKESVTPSALPSITVASRATLVERTVVDDDGEETIVSRLHKFDPSYRWLVIPDEAHRYALKLTSCGHVFEWFDRNPESRRFGLTATPERTDGTSLETLFPGVAIDFRMAGGTGRSAVAEGWAVPIDPRFIYVESVDFNNIPEVAGDLSEEQLGAVLTEQETLVSVCQPMLDKVGDRQTLIFSPTVAMADLVALWLNSKAGKTVSHSLCGEDKDETRRRAYEGFAAGRFQFLSVCQLCMEGFDEPNIGAVAIFRKTLSRSRVEQMIGRGLRPERGLVDGLDTAEERVAAIAASGKPNCIVIDLVGATGLDPCPGIVSIYADGQPDEVIERAKQKLLDGETDVAQAVEDADEEVKLEQIRRDEEARKRRQEEMDRRAKLKADVEYAEVRVKQGHGLETVSTRSQEWAANQTVTFGDHNGKRIGQLDWGYLQWLSRMPTKLGRAAATEMKTRQQAAQARKSRKSDRVMPVGTFKGKPMSQVPRGILAALARGNGKLAELAREAMS